MLVDIILPKERKNVQFYNEDIESTRQTDDLHGFQLGKIHTARYIYARKKILKKKNARTSIVGFATGGTTDRSSVSQTVVQEICFHPVNVKPRGWRSRIKK